jgi:hypothetical protein
MKSLAQITHDNRLTGRDLGGMCEWFVFNHGDFRGAFIYENDAKEFASNLEYADSSNDVTVSKGA